MGKFSGAMKSVQTQMKDINDAIYPDPGKVTEMNGRIGAFGGQTRGFSKETLMTATSNFYSQKSEADGMSIPIGMQKIELPRSIANQYALFNFKGMYFGLDKDPSAAYKDGVTGESNAISGGDNAKNVTLHKIISYFSENHPHIHYKPADFMYGKYYKKIPVNHLITVRRFASPCFDNIYDLKVTTKKGEKNVQAFAPAGSTAVTYLGETAKNPLSDILKFTYGLKWDEVENKMEEHQQEDKGYTNQPFYNKIGGVGRAVADTFKGVNAGEKFRKSNFSTDDALGTTFANFVLGPVNVVNKTYIRGMGLQFANDLTLTFEYSAKSLNYINPKIAMIDVMTNMMTLTYSNGQFFGGGHRFYGSGGFVASQFGDIAKLRNGDFAGYVGSVVNDVESGMKQTFGNGSGGFDLKSMLSGGLKVGKNMLGSMLGAMLGKEVGGAVGTFATKAFISAEPTGDWHVTVGNPLNPIVMMGNMICDTSTMTLGEGLGLDDFPVEAKFEISLKHGKPRDKSDIENMFNMGRGRIYASVKGEKDILNLDPPFSAGIYGCMPDIGEQSIQNMQGVVSENSTTPPYQNHAPKDINMANADTQKKIGQETGTSGEYVSNMISMIIDS